MPVAIITGAGSGMGAALARHLVEKNEGWHVMIADINSEGGEKVASSLNGNATFIQADCSNWEELHSLFAKTWDEHGRIDFVVANAGIADNFDFGAPLSTQESLANLPAPNLRTVSINLLHPVYTAYLAINYFRRNPVPGGKYAATASQAGLYAFPTAVQYCTSKHGVVGLVRALAVDPRLKEQNMTFNAVCPGIVMTGLVPQELKSVPVDVVTPMSTILDAYERIISGNGTGLVLECSKDRVYVRDEHPKMDDAIEKFRSLLLGMGKN